MDGHSTLQRIALQLKNKPRTLKQVARVFQKMIKPFMRLTFRRLRHVARDRIRTARMPIF